MAGHFFTISYLRMHSQFCPCLGFHKKQQYQETKTRKMYFLNYKFIAWSMFKKLISKLFLIANDVV